MVPMVIVFRCSDYVIIRGSHVCFIVNFFVFIWKRIIVVTDETNTWWNSLQYGGEGDYLLCYR